jgi:small subunit ribosomal protein S9
MAASLAHCARRMPRLPLSTTAHAPFRRKRIRYLSSASSFRQQLQDLQAAPELDLSDPVFEHKLNLLQRIRIVPQSPSYFSARSAFNDSYLHIDELYLKYNSLPKVSEPPRIRFLSHMDIKGRAGTAEKVKKTRYLDMISKLRELSAVEPILMPPEVKQAVEDYMAVHQHTEIKIKEQSLDEWGRSLGIGARKTSTAKVFLVLGDGQVLINNRNLTDYFGRLHDRESALWPLKITNRIDKYNVFGILTGGGLTGQAEAMTLAVAKALLVHEPELEERLREGS